MSENGGFRSINRTTGVGRIGSGGSVNSNIVLSKMVRANNYATTGIDSYYGHNAFLDMSAERQAENMDDYENILMTQPELELPIQILISCILSPKNASNITLKHSTKKNPLPADLNNKLLQSVKACVEDVYKIKMSLPERLRKALFTSGADVTLILSEAMVDDVINGKVEQIRRIGVESIREKALKSLVDDCTKPTGVFSSRPRKPDEMSTESILGNLIKKDSEVDDGHIFIGQPWNKISGFVAPQLCDNPRLLNLGMALEGLLEEKQREQCSGRGRTAEGLEKLYREIGGGIEPTLILAGNTNTTRKSLDRPIRRTIPTEACLPVVQPGNPKKALGYLLLVDEFGGFVSRETRRDYWKNINDVVGGNRGVVSSILEKSASALKTDDSLNDQFLAMAAASSFRELAIRETESRLLSGKLGNNEVFFNLMFERALAGRQTRVLYVPSDMITYWAYKYNPNGTGRSLLEDNKFLASMRTLLIIANTETQLRNSIDYTKLMLTFDPNDPNKAKTKELIIDQYIRHRLRSTPWATTHPRRVIEQLQMAGVSLEIDGGDNYPGTKVAIERQDIQQREVDTEAVDSCFKRIIMGLGIAPEIVDLSTNIEFSSKIVTSNELSLKRVVVLQDVTNHHLQRDAVKTIIADPIQLNEMEGIIKRWIAEQSEEDMPNEKKATLDISRIIDLFLASYEIVLPRPESGLEADLEEFDKFMDATEKVLERIINDDAVAGIDDGKLSDAYKRLRALILQHKGLEWMAEHDFMPDLVEDLRYERDTGIPAVIEEIISHVTDVNGVIKMLIPRLEAMNVVDSEQLTKILENINSQREETSPGDGGGSYESGSEESTGDSEGSGGMGDDDFGFSDEEETNSDGEAGTGGESDGDGETDSDAEGGDGEDGDGEENPFAL